MSLNLHMTTINEETFLDPTSDLKGPRKEPHYTAQDLAQITARTSLRAYVEGKQSQSLSELNVNVSADKSSARNTVIVSLADTLYVSLGNSHMSTRNMSLVPH